MTQLLPPKKEVALALLERSNVDIYLDPRARGVVVPPQFRKEPRLILKIGLNMPVPIPDLRLDDESMSCTLSFNRSPFYCVVPWSSVFAMVGDDGRGMVWPDDVPQELSVRVAEDQPSGASLGGRELGPPSSGSAGNGAPSSKGKRAPRIVEAAPDSGGNGKKRGGKKGKKEDGRPILMAVPAPPPSDARLDARSDEKGEKKDRDVKPDARTEERTVRRDGPTPLGGSPRMRPVQEKLRLEELPRVAAPPKAEDEKEKAAPPSKPEESATPSSTSGTPSTPSGTPSARPKRELPPYLRVVK